MSLYPAYLPILCYASMLPYRIKETGNEKQEMKYEIQDLNF